MGGNAKVQNPAWDWPGSGLAEEANRVFGGFEGSGNYVIFFTVGGKGIEDCRMNRLKIVLVVEDSAEDVELLQFASLKAGGSLAFHFVMDGEEAIAYLRGEGEFADRHAHPLPDLVLLDLWLPGMDGFEVLAWIRSRTEFSGLKVYVWTDAGDPKAIERATLAGADRFVPKSMVFVRGGLVGLVGGIAQALMSPAGAEAEEPIRLVRP